MQQLSLGGTYPDVGNWRPGKLSDEAYTPQFVLDFVEELRPIDTDPCWSPLSLVRPQVWAWMIQHKGLSQEWWGHVFCNPKYSDPYEWVKECIEHARRYEAWRARRRRDPMSSAGPVSILMGLDPSAAWAKMLVAFAQGQAGDHYYIDITRRVDFDRPFAKRADTQSVHNRGCNRLYLLGHSLAAVHKANKQHHLGTVQPLGGLT